MPTPPFPSQIEPNSDAARLLEVGKAQVAATLASALIIASGRPHSIAEALELAKDIRYSMYPANGSGHYEDWKKKFDPKKVHS